MKASRTDIYIGTALATLVLFLGWLSTQQANTKSRVTIIENSFSSPEKLGELSSSLRKLIDGNVLTAREERKEILQSVNTLNLAVAVLDERVSRILEEK